MVVVMSCKCGTLPINTGFSDNKVAARMGSGVFGPGHAQFPKQGVAASDKKFIHFVITLLLTA
jgi:hypothetical protein